MKIKSPEGTEMNTENQEVYYSRTRIQSLVMCFITIAILILLIVPVYALYDLVNKLGNNQTATICFGILLIFTLIFSVVLSLFTSARRHEILGAAAGYCAVLVVFLSNVGGNYTEKNVAY
jgi:magnesium-transporting ATPase (P-type)